MLKTIAQYLHFFFANRLNRILFGASFAQTLFSWLFWYFRVRIEPAFLIFATLLFLLNSFISIAVASRLLFLSHLLLSLTVFLSFLTLILLFIIFIFTAA